MIEVQKPNFATEEKAYLAMTAQANYTEMEQVIERLSELLHYHKNRLEYRKRTEMALDMVKQLEEEGEFPQADYAFDNGVLNLELTQFIEGCGKHWVTNVESSQLQWQNPCSVGIH